MKGGAYTPSLCCQSGSQSRQRMDSIPIIKSKTTDSIPLPKPIIKKGIQHRLTLENRPVETKYVTEKHIRTSNPLGISLQSNPPTDMFPPCELRVIQVKAFPLPSQSVVMLNEHFQNLSPLPVARLFSIQIQFRERP